VEKLESLLSLMIKRDQLVQNAKRDSLKKKLRLALIAERFFQRRNGKLRSVVIIPLLKVPSTHIAITENQRLQNISLLSL